MERLGTKYGGWVIPKYMNLSEDSVCYLGGVGEDASFDILLQNKYGSRIFMIDPTEKAMRHYNELVSNTPFTGNIQSDYYDTISGVSYDISKMIFVPTGLWNEEGELKFYKQSNPEYVSQSLITGMFSDKYDMIQVNTIKGIMDTYGHTHIDLLKLDIEGAECKVISKMLDDKIYPKYVLIEFDLLLKQKDTSNETVQVIKRMQYEGYKILCNDNMNITFVLQK